jgi:cytochrome c oxidase subunit 1
MSEQQQYAASVRRITLFWALTVPVLLLVLILLGLAMRFSQAGVMNLDPGLFYAIMTVHGLGMAGTAFVAGFAGMSYLLAKYARINLTLGWTMYVVTLIGVAGLVAACLLGRFGPGWYLLYPLPFMGSGVWPNWALGLAVTSLIALGVGWLLGQLNLAYALIERWGLTNTLGWQYLRHGKALPKTEIPPIVLIAVAGCLVPGILTTLDGAVLLMLYLFAWFNPSLSFDPLLLKNMVFLWGHTLVNITMYLGLAMVYEILPRYSGRPWKTNRIVVLSWNAVMFLVLFAFFHHLYMDFAQPVSLQYVGQIASYLSAVPATAVTVFGVIGQIYRSGMSWRFVPLSFFLGITGWVIGGFAAVVDSTIAVNSVFHNTLWVPAHFHTYFVAGFILILLGFLYEFSGKENEALAKTGLWAFVAGATGFLSMFYLGGALGVPRRFADYSAIPVAQLASSGQRTALIAGIAIVVLIVGFLLVMTSLVVGARRTSGDSAAV